MVLICEDFHAEHVSITKVCLSQGLFSATIKKATLLLSWLEIPSQGIVLHVVLRDRKKSSDLMPIEFNDVSIVHECLLNCVLTYTRRFPIFQSKPSLFVCIITFWVLPDHRKHSKNHMSNDRFWDYSKTALKNYFVSMVIAFLLSCSGEIVRGKKEGISYQNE